MADKVVKLDIDITEDNIEQYREAFRNCARRIMRMVGGQVERAAADLAPYDTGLLKNSITFAIAGEEADETTYKADRGGATGSYKGNSPTEPSMDYAVHVGTNVEYAMAQETGTFSDGAHEFLRPAVNNNIGYYKRIIEEELRKEMAGDT